MNAAATAARSARIIALVAVLGAAGVLGLAVGTALNERSPQAQTMNGYPPGWQGGAAMPLSRVATANFSVDALDAVRISRGDEMGQAAESDESDYFQRHPQLTTSNGSRIPTNVE